MKPRLLDLFCGAGGAAVGYHRAGFDVWGVDIKPQPHYPFEFIQSDAIQIMEAIYGDCGDRSGRGRGGSVEFRTKTSPTGREDQGRRSAKPGLGAFPYSFDAIHASPPCQKFSRTAHLARSQGKKASNVDLLTPIRPLLRATGLPYVIENVEGAPMESPIFFCGSSFDLKVRRHRLFESNLLLLGAPCDHERQGRPVGVYGSKGDDIPKGGKTAATVEEAQEAMGIDWMPRWDELKEAIPPAYTEWIGRQLLQAIGKRAA